MKHSSELVCSTIFLLSVVEGADELVAKLAKEKLVAGSSGSVLHCGALAILLSEAARFEFLVQWMRRPPVC